MEMERSSTKTRVRVWFSEEEENGEILKKCQRREGLKRSWIQLKPTHKTISHLSSFILHTFHLHHSCPNGIIITMDGFVLPPFESASILKDKDIIRVKKKGKLLAQGDDGENLIDVDEIVEMQALLTNRPLLANKEFESEGGGYQTESEEQDKESDSYEKISPGRKKVSKRRIASKKLGSSKKKKKKCVMDIQVSEDEFLPNQNKSNGFYHGESSGTKKEPSEVKKKKNKRASAIVSVESDYDASQPLPSPERSSPIQEDDVECDGSTQKPSRSARRKKAKRQWLSEIVKAEKEQLFLSNNTCSQFGTCNMQLEMQSPKIDVNKHSIEHQQQNESCEADNEIALDTEVVPIVIRPGHIRFEPLEEDSDGEAIQKCPISTEIVQWNGISNKKKGQKWGRENLKSWRDESQGSKKERSGTMEIEVVKPLNDPIDFANLAPLFRLPREGDLIAYRLVELSSTWTPELTSFRVGKTSWYDSVSNLILLTPLPEYSIPIAKLDEEDTFAKPPDNSFYKEDGSLEVEFSSLVDVRMVKESDSDPLMSNGGSSSTATANGNCTHDYVPDSEKQTNVWDEINETLNAKKAELMRENGWLKENSSWSCRAMRRSAMGPTMAMLRANNEI